MFSIVVEHFTFMADPNVVGQPVVGIPMMVDQSAPPSGKFTPDKPCTPLCSMGIIIVVIDVIGFLSVLTESFLATDGSFFRVLRFPIIIGLLGVIGAVVVVFKEDPVPRGCGCIAGCANAQSGCGTCPGVPWYMAISGGFGLLGCLWGVVAVVTFDSDDEELDTTVIWLSLIADLIFSLLAVIVGSVWLHRFSKQHGYLCCK